MSRESRWANDERRTAPWSVYIVDCADGSLYTGIPKDLARRLRQHNAGTASKYTRTRLPVKLLHYEAHPTQSSALKRELCIKALDRREKLAMVKRERNLAKRAREVVRLEEVPNVGPSIA